MSDRKDIEAFIVIDDEIGQLTDFGDNDLIQTNYYVKYGVLGLSESHIEKIVNILNKHEKVLKKI